MIATSRFLIYAALILSAFAMWGSPGPAEGVRSFLLPQEIEPYGISTEQEFRMAGFVHDFKRGGITWQSRFNVADGVVFVQVEYNGLLPDLFKEGLPVAVHGYLNDNWIFVADEVLVISEHTIGKYFSERAAEEFREWGLIDF